MIDNQFLNKIGRVRRVMEEREIPAVIIQNQGNFSWLTGGRSFIGLTGQKSCCKILITRERVFVITDNIEAPRLKEEEIKGLHAEVLINPWYEQPSDSEMLKHLGVKGTPLYDEDLTEEFRGLRTTLTGEELQKIRWLGKEAAMITETTAREIERGCSEYDVWGRIACKAFTKGIEPVTVLIGFDERIFKFRHPLPTAKRLSRYAMLATVMRKWGLHVSNTRFVSFGPIDKELEEKFDAVACIDTALILGTKPGNKVGDIFKHARSIYEEKGYHDEWKKHHQGGLTGFEGREIRAFENSCDVVKINQVYAWNPSISGAKSEDTILIHPHENEIITHTGMYEYMEIQLSGVKLRRPSVFIKE